MLQKILDKFEERSAKSDLDPGIIATIILSGLFFSVILAICIYRYNTLQYHDWDLALFSNGLTNLLSGRPFITIINYHLLRNHFTPIAFSLIPVYMLFKSPVTLLVLQTLAISAVSIPLYMIARKDFNWRVGIIFVMSYLMYPALIYPALYEFHFETVSMIFLILTFYFLVENNKVLCLVSALLAISCKENIPSVIAGIGLFGVLFKPKRRLLGFFLFLLGVSSFFIITLKLMPLFYTAGSTVGRASQYAQYGSGFGNIYVYMFTHPLAIARDLFSTPVKLQFFSRMFTPLLFLPLLRPDLLLMTAPTILRNLLSKVPTNHEIYWHYTAPMIPFMILSLIYSCVLLKKLRTLKKYIPHILCLILLMEAIAGFMFYRRSYRFVKFHFPATHVDGAKIEALGLVPENEPVIATFDFLPKLSGEKDLYSFYTVWRKMMDMPENIKYALIDFNDYFIRKDIYACHKKISEIFSGILIGRDWNLKFAKGDIALFEKTSSYERKLVSIADTASVSDPNKMIVIDDTMELVDIRRSAESVSNTLHLTFFWKYKKPSDSLFELRFFAEKKGFIAPIAIHPLAYRLRIPSLPPDKIIREDYWLIIPRELEADIYNISMDIVNIFRREISILKPSGPGLVDDQGFIPLGPLEISGSKKQGS